VGVDWAKRIRDVLEAERIIGVVARVVEELREKAIKSEDFLVKYIMERASAEEFETVLGMTKHLKEFEGEDIAGCYAATLVRLLAILEALEVKVPFSRVSHMALYHALRMEKVSAKAQEEVV